MTIVIVCDVLGEENNGTTIAAMNLIRSLQDKGHEVRVICPDEGRRGEEGFYIVDTMNFGPLNNYVRKNGVSLAKGDRRVIEDALEGADAVHVIIPFVLGTRAMRIARKKGLPVTASFHCQAENITSHIFLKDSDWANKMTYKTLNRLFYRHVDAIHYPTQFIREMFEQYVGETNGYVISNGVGKAFRPKKVKKSERYADRYVILFTGRYSKEKSHKVLIDAAAKSRHAGDIQLVFAGEGPLKEELKKRSEKLPNPPIFRFFARDEMIRMINCADLYVHPAEIEIEAISCLEAISCGRVPVISNSPRSATRFFALTDKNLFACNDSDDLSEKIDYWIEHPEEKEICSREYEGFAKQFDFDECMDRMEAMICETAEKRDGAA